MVLSGQPTALEEGVEAPQTATSDGISQSGLSLLYLSEYSDSRNWQARQAGRQPALEGSPGLKGGILIWLSIVIN